MKNNLLLCNLLARGHSLKEARALAEGKPAADEAPQESQPVKPAPSEIKKDLAAKIEAAGGIAPAASKSVKAFEKALADAEAPIEEDLV